MDSFDFHFEGTSNLDVQPLSCPGSRLSPAKSTSSIDQFSHHHGKGDSAYSSFSGGSNAPDYASAFLPEDIQHQSLQYTDLKYVKGVYSPNILNINRSASVDQLFETVEGVSQECYCHSSCHGGYCHREPPPPPPARLDSFITIKNLENYRENLSSHGPWAGRSHHRSETANPDAVHPRQKLAYGRRISQSNLECPEGLEDSDQTPKQKPIQSSLNQQSSPFIQPEFLKQQVVGAGNWSENQSRRSRSEQRANLPEQLQPGDTQHAMQNLPNGHIQHKGNFYFVTGVCKSSESSCRETLSEGEISPSTADHHRLVEMEEKLLSPVVDHNVRQGHENSHDGWQDSETCHKSQEVYDSMKDEESQSKVSCAQCNISNQGFYGLESLEETTSERSFSSQRHPIFYCGPEDGATQIYKDDKDTVAVLNADQGGVDKKADLAVRGKRQPLGDLASDKINKETTPLLYHLTGENRGVLMHRPKSDTSGKWRESRRYSAPLRQQSVEEGSTSSRSGILLNSTCSEDRQGQDRLSSPVGTLDESFKKYYREKLKDAQKKVLRETSFKRRDLQLSWPHRIKPRLDLRPSFLNSAVSLQGSPVTPESPSPCFDLETELQGKENRNWVEAEEQGKDKAKLPSVPQPQVARIGSRRRLTSEQKKLCYSEPEKLNQVGAAPLHPVCNSLGNEEEGLLSRDDLSEQGLVASRKKLFETRDRAFSASGLPKNTLKQIQQKALVAYMERKTGQKTTEPQQPLPSQRHSTAGRPPDLALRPLSGNVAPRPKLLRPLSAGRILDSSGPFQTSQFSSVHSDVLPCKTNWRECTGSATGKSASAETLLDQPEQGTFFQTRSTSTPYNLQVEDDIHKPLVSSTQNSCAQKRPDGAVRAPTNRAVSVSGDIPARPVALRGKSMEELGTGRIDAVQALSKSSEQLDLVGDRRTAPGREQRRLSFWEATRKLQVRPIRTPVVRQDTAPELGSEAGFRGLGDGLEWPQCGSPKTTGPPSPSEASSVVGNSVFYVSDAEPPFPSSQASQERRTSKTGSVSPSSPTGSRIGAAPPVHTLLPDQDDVPRPDPSQEVFLGRGVTTDRSSWLVTQNEEVMEESRHISGETESPSALPEPAPHEPPVATTSEGPDLEENEGRDGDLPEEETEKGGETVVETGAPENVISPAKPQWQVLVEEVVAEDQSLARVLLPVTNRKTAVMLMEELLSEDTLLMEEHYRHKHTQQAGDSCEILEEQNMMPPSSENPDPDGQMQDGHVNKGSDITGKKRALMECIKGRLQLVEKQRVALKDEMEANGLWGGAVDTLVQQSCPTTEYERYTLFVGDLERVVSLLLCLSARLARVRNALSAVGEQADAEEKQSLDNRHRLLCKQQEDAKDLKDNLDRRERVVSAILARVLTAEQLQDYRCFVQTKAALLIRLKDLDEKQRLGEEQLETLLNSIPS
ncbi:protein Shroom3 isoform X2 [Brienomyrus brachyistius]|uniref:protein Shroom3 isoform X2 n=1 Tax=Brienomyrus brachyistius TaxID=42636 RepID=UPI0020B30037|nr:protein Shroom3 isoform X2 [Brienomyrus brachyistius]